MITLRHCSGAYTLEGLALAVDPSSQRLIPASLIMY